MSRARFVGGEAIGPTSRTRAPTRFVVMVSPPLHDVGVVEVVTGAVGVTG